MPILRNLHARIQKKVFLVNNIYTFKQLLVYIYNDPTYTWNRIVDDGVLN